MRTVEVFHWVSNGGQIAKKSVTWPRYYRMRLHRCGSPVASSTIVE